MSQQDHPNLSEKGRADAAARQRRQAEALRANLARRKARERLRHDDESRACPDDGHGLKDPET